MKKINKYILFFLPVFYLLFSCKTETIADIVLINGTVITVDKDFSIAEAIAIKNDKILAVGSNKEINKLTNAKTILIDLKGKTVIPGLIDSHCHPEIASVSELYEEVPDVHTIAELLEWIKTQAGAKKKGEWIIFNRMFYTRLNEMRPPSLYELDSVAPNNPVFLNGSYGGMINTSAMVVSEINEKLENKGLIKDKETGKLTGFIRNSAFKLLKRPSPPPLSNEEKVKALQDLFKEYNNCGITGIISGSHDYMNFKRYQEMSDNEQLTLRISQNFRLPFHITDSKERLVDSLRTLKIVTGQGDEWVRAGSLKIVLDGGILTGTAFMREPWGEKAMDIFDINDLSYQGIVNFSRNEILNIVTAANELNWSFTAHCTGSGSVDLLLDVFEEANKIKPVKGRRFSIIHGNFYNEKSIKQMQELEILANCQAAWFYKDADAMKEILGDNRVKDFNPFGSLNKAGVIVCGGSDHMDKLDPNTSINPYNPFLSMWSMITRKTEKGNVIEPTEAISRMDALKMYTVNNAIATFEENIKGSLEIGKLADLVIISENILNCPVDNIKNIQSELTMVGGKIVFQEKTN